MAYRPPALPDWDRKISFGRYKDNYHLFTSQNQRWDRTSGQIFSEITLPAQPRLRTFRWPTARVELGGVRRAQGRGAPSLEDLAVREVVRNIGCIDADVLAELPWQLGSKIWDHAEQLELTTLSVWQAFATAFPDEAKFAYYRSSEIVPQLTFPEYLESISSPTSQWLTCLTLSMLSLSRADIMSLAQLHNLVALDISSTSSSNPAADLVDDQVIRNWARHAQETGAFAKLQVLILRHQAGVTPKSFEYLSSFPSLVLLGVKDCNVTERDPLHPETHGWTRHDDGGLIRKVQRDIELSHTWDSPLRHCYETATEYASSSSQPQQPNSLPAAKPLLNFRLGHTTNDILLSSPLVFFRCLQHKRRNSDAESSSLHADALGRAYTQAGVPEQCRGSSNLKKRKLRAGKQVDLGNFLADMDTDGDGPQL